MSTFYITTAIDYVNSLPHLGTAYEKICADCVARFHRLLGEDVFFLMGTDEHSKNVVEAAKREGLEPREYCDRMAAQFESTWQALHISHDRFIRTTDGRHVDTVTELLRRIHAAGDIFKDKYTGFYCHSCEAFLAEKELVDGNCANHGKPPEWIEEENYFFRLSKYQEPLLAHIEANPSFIEPETRRNEVLAWFREGLQDISISRSGSEWGIALPFDPDTVTYVWFDALMNYVSGIGFTDDQALFEKYWPCDCHVIGKDITRFHCIIWPAILLAAEIPLPKQVYAHGWVNFDGQKMSKSAGTSVDPLEAADLFGPDALRYYLLRHVSYGKDGDFSWHQFIDRFNADLANDLGNLFNRVRTLAAKDLDGNVPRPANPTADPLDKELAETAGSVRERYVEHLSNNEIHRAIDAVWELVGLGNVYVEKTSPWHLSKPDGDRDRLAVVLYNLAELVRWCAVLLSPVLPAKTDEMWSGLGLSGTVEEQGLSGLNGWGGVDAYSGIERGRALFPRIDKSKLSFGGEAPAKKKQQQKKKKKKKKGPAEPPAEISIEDVMRLDLRVATVKSAERVPDADKLLRLEIEIAGEDRQLVAGIAEHYEPADLVGQQIVVVANLKPTEIRGVRSQGMLLAASSDGTLALVQPAKQINSGARVR